MKIVVYIKTQSANTSNPIQRAIETVFGIFTNLVTVVNKDTEADIVVTNDLPTMLECLKQGKYVAQLLLAGETAATGLLTAPNFKDHFRIFAVVDGMKDGYPGFIQMLPYLEEIVAKESASENPSS